MITTKNSTFSPKITRSPYKKNIHYLFISNKSGICLYSKNFTNIYKMKDRQLISSFFTAIRAFAKELIGKSIKTIDMGVVKIVIFKKGAFYYGLLCNSIENLILLKNVILKINFLFIDYLNVNKINVEAEYISDANLDIKIDQIVNEIISNEFDLRKEQKIIENFNKLSLNDDILGIILLTDRGKVIYSSKNQLNLKYYLKEVDFRVKICNNNILKLFYTSKDNNLIFSEYVNDLYFVILVFNSEIKFGLAEYYLTKAVNIIKKHLD